MKVITVIITILIFSSVNSILGQCGPEKVEPIPQVSGLCEGSSDTIDFVTIGTCSGGYEYQVESSTNVILQPWSTNSQYVTSSSITDTYTVYARCSMCPSTVVSDTFLIQVIPAPFIIADTFVCYGTSANFSATGSSSEMISWWDNSTDGTRLSTTGKYTSPPLNSDDTIYVRVDGTVTGIENKGSILITECGLEGFLGQGAADYIEISNLYSTPVNTAGWVVAVSQSFTDINEPNSILWELPELFDPCSMLSKTDVPRTDDYWGNNIWWGAEGPGWAAIVDDVGNLVDFIAWGWSEAELAGFNSNINGFNITLEDEWIGDGCYQWCEMVGGIPYSFSRTGNSDNNNADDFTCQATSFNVLNPGLECGWVSSNITCPYPVIVKVDLPPTASVPDTTKVSCYSDIPLPDVSIITDALDDHMPKPIVEYMGETSNGRICPEVLTRTYKVTDSCSNFIELEHIIVIHDTVAPIMEPAPDDLYLYCYADIPPMVSREWTDNCLGSGTALGVETSNGRTCPEIITRTWTITDTCGNTATETQIITIFDTIPPKIDAAPANLSFQCPSGIPPMVSLNWTDNCLGSGVLNGVEVSSGTCPEIITRTWTITDTCGNTATETQIITIFDTIPPKIDAAPANLSLQCLSEVPPMVSLNWTDNCVGSGVLRGEEVSDGKSCPETITRTWTVTDDCDNRSTETQIIVINDDTPPTASNLPSLQLTVLPPADINLITDAADNCGTPVVEWVEDISDNGFCPENIIRTYSVTDDCGNVTYVTQNFTIGDNTPNVSFTANPALLDNFSDGIVNFKNQTTGAVSYIWDFGDDSPTSNQTHPSHKYDISSSRYYEAWLVAISEYDCKDSTNFIIEVFHELVYFVPNAFTPDGDNFNQTFQPVFAAGFDPNDYNLTIYNRWGQILFESNNHEVGWDGTYEGVVVPDGTYVYKIEFGLENSQEKKTISGHFSLLR